MRHAVTLAPLPALIALALATPATGQGNATETADTADPGALNRITVTATRSPQKSFDLPLMTSVVDADDPSVASASMLKDMLGDVPGLEFSGSARRNGQNMVMRGFDSDSLVVLFDGVRQRGESGHDGKFFIDPALLKTVEVVRGPNSTLYGSGGLGGVVAFTTKDAADLLEPGQRRGMRTTLGGASVNDEWLLSQSAYLQSERNDVLVSLLRRESGDIELGDGSRLVAEDEVTSGLLKLGHRLSDHSEVSFSAQLYRNEAVEPNNPQSSSNSDLMDKDTRSWQGALEYRYHDPASTWVDLNLRLYRTDTDIEETDILTARNLGRRMDRSGLVLENQSRFGGDGPLRQTLTYGLEYYTENQDGADSSTADGEAGGIPDADYEYRGLYLQDEIALQTRALPGEWLLIPGVRLDRYESSNTGGASIDESEASPRLGLSYRPDDWLMLFSSYGRAFRAPTIGEAYTTGVHFTIPGMGSNVFVPNPDLRPETSTTLEYGIGLQFRDLVSQGDALSLKASRFETEGEDFIDTEVTFTPVPCCGTTTATNIPDAELWGYELEGSYENRHLRLGFGFSKVNGRNQATGDYLVNITPPTLTLNLGIRLPAINATAGWRARLVERHDKVNDPGAERHGYGVHDLYFQWLPGAMDNLTLNLGVDNLFDKDYERVFAGSPEAGRNINLQLSYQW